MQPLKKCAAIGRFGRTPNAAFARSAVASPHRRKSELSPERTFTWVEVTVDLDSQFIRRTRFAYLRVRLRNFS